MKNKFLGVISLIFLSCIITVIFAGMVSKNNFSVNDKKVVNNKKNNENKSNKKKKFERNKNIDVLNPVRQEGKNANITGERLSSNTLLSVDNLKDGSYIGSAQGYEGKITVKVIIEYGKIKDIVILSHNETPGYYERGFKVIDSILAKQNVNVDSISGATITSRAVMVATARALKAAINNDITNNTNIDLNLDTIDEPNIEKRDIPLNFEKYNSESWLSNLNIDLSKVKDGIYIGSAEGFNGKNGVKVKIVSGKIVEIIINDKDDRVYFTDDKKNALIAYLKQDLNISDSKTLDSVSGATYSSNSIIRAIKSALKEYKLSGYSVVNISDYISIFRNNETNEDILKADVHLPVCVRIDGIVQSTVNLGDSQYVRLKGFNKNVNLSIVDYIGNILYDKKVENEFKMVDSNEYKKLLNEISKKINFISVGLGGIYSNNNILVDKIDEKIDNKTVLEAYKINADNAPYIIGMPKYDGEVEFWFNDNNSMYKLYSYSLGDRDYALAKGNGKFYIVKSTDKYEKLKNQIIQWNTEVKNMNYFVMPLMPDTEMKDGKYLGYGYGYKAFTDEDKWRVEVSISNGNISEIKLLNQPDDDEYVKYSKNFQDKLTKGKLNDINKLIALHVELEKIYSLEPTVIHKFNKELPMLDEKVYLGEIKNNAKNIETDAVSGATISTTGMIRAIMDALSKAALAKQNDGAVVSIDKIVISNYPKSRYEIGDRLQLDNLSLKLFYTNGTEEEIGFNELGDKGIQCNIENGKELNEAGNIKIIIGNGQVNAEFDITVISKINEDTYVSSYIGDYDSKIFVRPPEINSKLRDGEYIGHGKGYYYDSPWSTVPINYVQTTKVKLTVENGKVTRVDLLHFGDDVAGGGIGYKAKGAVFRASAGDLVKKDVNAFIKQHLDFERYMAAVYTKDSYPMFAGDTTDKVIKELRQKMRDCDAVSGATYSSIGYSRAIAEALYKASIDKKMINDMWLSDYDWAIDIFTNESKKILYFAKPETEIINERISNNYHQTHYYPGEKFNTNNLILTVMYTDGSVEKYNYEQMINNGFKLEILNAKFRKGKEGYINTPITDYMFEYNVYGQVLNIYREDTDKHIKSEYVNSDLYSNFRR